MKRIPWVDQIRGFVIILTLYINNSPSAEVYISSFVLPLILMIAGLFHPKEFDKIVLKKRIERILVPYFLWSIMLFVFWLFIGRFFGESQENNLSIWKNFVGIFYAQGGNDYMNWGVPIWFLPMIFVVFILFEVFENIPVKRVKYVLICFISLMGYFLSDYTEHHFPWSIDVAMVCLVFYAFGCYFKKQILYSEKKFAFLMFGLVHLFLFGYNTRINLFKSDYGNYVLFVLNGLSGSLFYIGFFKYFPIFKWLSFFGLNSITVLAAQQRAMSVIKLCLLLFLGVKYFNFTEIEKLLYSFVQVLLIIPVIFFVNRYANILNGKILRK
ncbi:acyltransferase family protein [Wenyingzhuangia sp. IMCC45533]